MAAFKLTSYTVCLSEAPVTVPKPQSGSEQTVHATAVIKLKGGPTAPPVTVLYFTDQAGVIPCVTYPGVHHIFLPSDRYPRYLDVLRNEYEVEAEILDGLTVRLSAHCPIGDDD